MFPAMPACSLLHKTQKLLCLNLGALIFSCKYCPLVLAILTWYEEKNWIFAGG
jgi:hypothetical protein